MYYPQRVVEFIIRPRSVILICIGNKQTSFTTKKFSAMQLGIHNLYISSKLEIFPPLHIYNTHIPSCIVNTLFMCIHIPVHKYVCVCFFFPSFLIVSLDGCVCLFSKCASVGLLVVRLVVVFQKDAVWV